MVAIIKLPKQLLAKKIDFAELPDIFTVYKGTRANGRDGHTGTIDYHRAMLTGAYVYPLADDVTKEYIKPTDPNGAECGHGIHVCLSPIRVFTYQYSSNMRMFRCRARKCDIVGYGDDKIRLRRLDRVEQEMFYEDVYGVSETTVVDQLKGLRKILQQSIAAKRLAPAPSVQKLRRYGEKFLSLLANCRNKKIPIRCALPHVDLIGQYFYQFENEDLFGAKNSRITSVSPGYCVRLWKNPTSMRSSCNSVVIYVKRILHSDSPKLSLCSGALSRALDMALLAAMLPADSMPNRPLFDFMLEAYTNKIFVAGKLHDYSGSKKTVYLQMAALS